MNKPLMTDTLRKAFLGHLGALAESHPLLLGFQAILGDLHDDAVRTGGTLGVPAEDRAFLDGRQSMAQDGLEELATLWQEARLGPQEQAK